MIMKKASRIEIVKKLYTENEVKRLLKEQKKIWSIMPLLCKSRKRNDWREWNKFLLKLSKAIKDAMHQPQLKCKTI